MSPITVHKALSYVAKHPLEVAKFVGGAIAAVHAPALHAKIPNPIAGKTYVVGEKIALDDFGQIHDAISTAHQLAVRYLQTKEPGKNCTLPTGEIKGSKDITEQDIAKLWVTNGMIKCGTGHAVQMTDTFFGFEPITDDIKMKSLTPSGENDTSGEGVFMERHFVQTGNTSNPDNVVISAQPITTHAESLGQSGYYALVENRGNPDSTTGTTTGTGTGTTTTGTTTGTGTDTATTTGTGTSTEPPAAVTPPTTTQPPTTVTPAEPPAPVTPPAEPVTPAEPPAPPTPPANTGTPTVVLPGLPPITQIPVPPAEPVTPPANTGTNTSTPPTHLGDLDLAGEAKLKNELAAAKTEAAKLAGLSAQLTAANNALTAADKKAADANTLATQRLQQLSSVEQQAKDYQAQLAKVQAQIAQTPTSTAPQLPAGLTLNTIPFQGGKVACLSTGAGGVACAAGTGHPWDGTVGSADNKGNATVFQPNQPMQITPGALTTPMNLQGLGTVTLEQINQWKNTAESKTWGVSSANPTGQTIQTPSQTPSAPTQSKLAEVEAIVRRAYPDLPSNPKDLPDSFKHRVSMGDGFIYYYSNNGITWEHDR